MSTAVNLTINDSSAVPQNFSLVAKDTGYCRWELPGADGKLSQAIRLALKNTPPSNRQDETISKNRVLVTKPRFDVDGNSLTPLFAEVQFSVPNGATDTERADLASFVKGALADTLISGQIEDNDLII